MGIEVHAGTSGAEFVTKITRLIQAEAKARGSQSIFSAIAQRSLQSVITATIAERATGLFGAGLDEIRGACQYAANGDRFGLVARQFFAEFMSAAVRFVADKEVANYVGVGKALESVDSIEGFHRGIDRYCHDSGDLIQKFAASWYGKKNKETNNKIAESDTRRFTSYALCKLHMELSGVAE